MIPLLYPGNKVLVTKLAKGSIGDIVVFKNPQKNTQVKYLIKKITKINTSQVYVEGVNKNESIDSRQFGWVLKKDIIGKMIKKIS